MVVQSRKVGSNLVGSTVATVVPLLKVKRRNVVSNSIGSPNKLPDLHLLPSRQEATPIPINGPGGRPRDIPAGQ